MKRENNTQLLVSVVMPCFNDGKYIDEAIASVLSQTYKNVEIIVIDDGSTDQLTKTLLANKKWPKTKIIHIPHSGPSFARNIGIQESCGQYILPLDSDDKIKPTYIEKALRILETQPNVGIVYCQAEFFGKRTGKWRLPEYSLARMLLENIIFVCALFRKEDWQKVGGFKPEFVDGMEDYDFWLSIIELGREVVQLPELLFLYRIKENSRTKQFIATQKKLIDSYDRIYCNHPKLFSENIDLFVHVLRKALLDQIEWSKKYRGIIEKLGQIKELFKGKKI